MIIPCSYYYLQGGSGSANSIIFTNIVMKNVARPIIIDQNYCDSKSPCAEKVSKFSSADAN